MVNRNVSKYALYPGSPSAAKALRAGAAGKGGDSGGAGNAAAGDNGDVMIDRVEVFLLRALFAACGGRVVAYTSPPLRRRSPPGLSLQPWTDAPRPSRVALRVAPAPGAAAVFGTVAALAAVL